jgi:hypothetical protein
MITARHCCKCDFSLFSKKVISWKFCTKKIKKKFTFDPLNLKKASGATVYNQGGSAAFLSIFSYAVQFLKFKDQSRTRFPPKFESLLLYLCFRLFQILIYMYFEFLQCCPVKHSKPEKGTPSKIIKRATTNFTIFIILRSTSVNVCTMYINVYMKSSKRFIEMIFFSHLITT